MHISTWYAGTHLKRFAAMLGTEDIVAETMLRLLSTQNEKWDKYSIATIVTNRTKWVALELYAKHKKLPLTNEDRLEEAYEEFDLLFTVQRQEINEALVLAKKQIVASRGRNPDLAKRNSRYNSGLIEKRIVNSETLQDLADSFRITKERARQIEGKFLREMQLALARVFGLHGEQVFDFLLYGELLNKRRFDGNHRFQEEVRHAEVYFASFGSVQRLRRLSYQSDVCEDRWEASGQF